MLMLQRVKEPRRLLNCPHHILPGRVPRRNFQVRPEICRLDAMCTSTFGIGAIFEFDAPASVFAIESMNDV